MKNDVVLVPLNKDLRVRDNPALFEAVKKYKVVVPVYVFDKKLGREWKMGYASKWWLHHSLKKLSEKIPIVVLEGDCFDVLDKIVRKTKASAIYWNKDYEPYAIERDRNLTDHFTNKGVEVKSFHTSLLFEPQKIKNSSGQYYKVFTPFWNACKKNGIARRSLSKVKVARHGFEHLSVDIEKLKLVSRGVDQLKGLKESWVVGEEGAWKRFESFIKNDLRNYAAGRNRVGESLTSRLSPHLHFGEISALEIWNKLKDLSPYDENVERYLTEIGWREFAYYLLYHFPTLPTCNFKKQFDTFEWEKNNSFLKAWQRGLTGYPIVDAGMRELLSTGFMHNRARMVTASFLIKDLLIDWREGAKWFWDNLVDADLATNSFNWQWVAGTGADAAPYFRIFNPILQGEKYDPEGKYVRKWVPEIALLPNNFIHKPWLASEDLLKKCKIELGVTYPEPIVSHNFSKKIALELYKKL